MIKLKAIFVRIAQIQRLAHTVITRAFERNLGGHQASQRVAECRSIRIKDRDMKESGAARRWRQTVTAFPCVETDMMVIRTS